MLKLLMVTVFAAALCQCVTHQEAIHFVHAQARKHVEAIVNRPSSALSFTTLQSSPDISACLSDTGFTTNLANIQTQCTDLTAVVSSPNASVVNRFCSGSCPGVLAVTVGSLFNVQCLTLVAGFTSVAQTMSLFSLTQFACAKDERGESCGLIYDKLKAFSANQCVLGGYTTREACTAVSGCYFDQSDRQCTAIPTQEGLAAVCSNCLPKLVDLLVQSSLGGTSPQQGALLSRTFDLYCMKDGDKFCLPQLYNLPVSEDKFPADNEVAAMCDKEKCFRRFSQAAFVLMVNSLDEDYLRCARGQNANYVQSFCVRRHLDTLREIRNSEKTIQVMCSKNGDRFCVGLLNEASKNVCVGSVQSSGTCSAECSTSLGTMVQGWGCCTGTIQKIVSSGGPSSRVGVEDLPILEGVVLTNPPRPSESPVANTDGVLFLRACASLAATIDDTAAFSCEAPKGFAPKKTEASIRLQVSYERSRAPEVKSKLVKALTTDVANNFGLAPSELVDTDLVEDKTVTVQAVAQGHEMAQLQAGTSGTKFVFAFQLAATNTRTPEQLKADLAAATATNTLALPATKNTVKTQCSGCTGTAGLVAAPQASAASYALPAALTMLIAAVLSLAL